MIIDTPDTETVVRHHLTAFLEQRGIDAIVADYREDAVFFSEDETFCGQEEIGKFFADFIDTLPKGSFDRFVLRTLRVRENYAYITWSVGKELPLGTDTFVVTNGKITFQTYASHSSARRLDDHP